MNFAEEKPTLENADAQPVTEDPKTGSDRSRRTPRMALTRDLRRPTEYVTLMNGEYSEWALNEERAPKNRGQWRTNVFKVGADHPLDLEIGTGNGYHFAHLAEKSPERALVGLELKFKPLIQSIRRALRTGAKNARIARYDANLLEHLFGPEELNNVYIHHPDPWPKERQWKHRLIQSDFLVVLHGLMKPGSFVDFKTDSREYFEWAIERFKTSPFQVTRESWDLHRSEWQSENFVTHFETIFLSKGQPIHYARLVKS